MDGMRSDRWHVWPIRRALGLLAMAMVVSGALDTEAFPAAAVPAEFPYVEDIRQGKTRSPSDRLILRSSPKLDLVMIVAGLADAQRAFQRALAGNPLGAFWTNNTRQLSFEDAPKHLRELRSQGLWGDHLLEFAMHLSEPPELERILPWSANLLSVAGGSETETPEARLDRFVRELRVFAEKCRFQDRLSDKRAEYERLEELLASSFRGLDPLDTNATFWGVDPAGDFHLIPSPMLSGGHMASITAAGRTHQFLAFGPAQERLLANEGFLRHLVYHELSHPLIDPILQERAVELDASKSLWFAVSSELSGNQNILTWTDCVGEHLLRAYNIRRLREEDPVLAELSITSEQSSGYLYARQFLGLLDTYSRGRKQWAGLSAFLPEMTSRLAGLAENYADLDPRSRPPEFSVSNGGFEEHGEGWMLKNWELVPAGSVPTSTERLRTQVTRDTSTSHGGTASLRLDVQDATRDLIAVEQAPLAVRAGGTVRISGWVKAENVHRVGSQQRVCGLYVLFLDRRGEVLSRGETDSAVGTLDWTELAGEFIAPAGTAHARLGVLLGMSGTAWLDDLELERLD